MPEPIRDPHEYLSEVFQPEDRIAVSLIHKHYQAALARTPALASHRPMIQRTGLARDFASPRYLRFLRWMNSQGYEVYSTANTVGPNAFGRKKTDILEVRHLFLDFDDDGESAVKRLLARRDLPHPNYIVQTSPGKYQVLWSVHSVAVQDAELLLRILSRETGADIAVTDAARVLRLPGFYNNKYAPSRHLVTALRFHTASFTLCDFPAAALPPPTPLPSRPVTPSQRRPYAASPAHSRSELDFQNTLRRLRRCEGPPGIIPDTDLAAAIDWLAAERSDKHNPVYYASLTVGKARDIIASTPRLAHKG